MFLNMLAVNQPEVMIGNAGEHFDAEGDLTNETTKGLIHQLLGNLASWTCGLQKARERGGQSA